MTRKATLRGSEEVIEPISDQNLKALLLQKEESAREKNGDNST